MKKMLIVGLATIFLSLASLSSAGEYEVRKGDCLSKIGKQTGMSWQEIAKVNNIKSPYTIYVGQKLQIPSVAPASMQKTAAPVQIRPGSEYQRKIESLEAQICELERRIKEAVAVKVAGVAKASGGRAQVGQETVVGAQTEIVSSVTTKKTESPVVAETAVQSLRSYVDNDQFDMSLGFGAWMSEGNKDKSTGSYAQGKVRYRPFILNLFDHEVGVGGFLLGETGAGATENASGKWHYRWNKFGGGATSKVYGNRWDNSTDLGWVRQWDYGVNDKQITDFVYLLNYLNLEQRRGAGQKWFPQTELMFAATIPFSASKESTKSGKTLGQSLPADNKSVYSIDVRQSIYDFDLGNHMRLTPGAILGGGYEATNPYGKVGAFLKLGVYGQDIVTADISVKDKSSVDGVRWYGALMLNVGGAIKAYKASQITEPTAVDLRAK